VQTLDRDELTTFIDASPEEVYALIADVTRTPEFSPEVVHCEWVEGSTGPAVGARFEATNKVGRGRAWKNRPVVLAAEPGREFAFSRTEKFSGTIVWRYRFEPQGTGTRVTESYEVTRPVSRLGWFVIERFFGGRDRRGDLRRGMQQTLERLCATAEAAREARR
jgi:uncharacterized protein YndB with AHSA1/START domain